jgi:putative isomerase
MSGMNYDTLKKSIMQGWNTWNTRSVLSHVLLPFGFSINLCIKNYRDGSVLREALIGRFAEDDEHIHPGPRSYGGDFTELTLTYRGLELLIQSVVKDGEQYVLVSPVQTGIRPPALLVEGCMLWNRPGYVTAKDDHIEGVFADKVIKVYTDGESIDEYNTGALSPYLSVLLSKPIAISTGHRAKAADVKKIVEDAREKLNKETEKYGDLAEVYNAMRTCMAWDTIYEPEKDRICSPVSRIWSVHWGGYVLFCWDTYFASMLSMIDNKELAYANAIEITREKTENGFVPNFGAASNYKSRDRSQPPVGSLAVKEIYRRYREKWFLEEVFEDLLVWNRWFAAHRVTPENVLCWGSDPYVPVSGAYWEYDGVDNRLGAALESGLDNSPMYDDVPFDEKTHMIMLADVGLTGLYIMDCEALGEIARELGREAEQKELLERAECIKAGLNTLWDPETGFFQNKRTDTGMFYKRIAPTNFYALLSDQVTTEQADRIISEHFYNPSEFWGDWILPTIARNDPAYVEQDYWRGRIWAPTNFLAYISMRKQGMEKACADLARKSKELLLQEWMLHGHVHENYDGDTGMGCGVRNSDKFYHWGALLSLIALMDGNFIDGPEKPL